MKSSLSSLISVYPVESCQKRSVDEVGKDDEGVGLVQVEQEDGRDEGHALEPRLIFTHFLFSCFGYLNITKVWSVAHIGAQQVSQCGVVGTPLLNTVSVETRQDLMLNRK